MALKHARTGEVVDVRPLGSRLVDTPSKAIVRDDRIEVMRLVLLEGRDIPEHFVEGPVTFQCLEGRVALEIGGERCLLEQGELVYLEGGVPYALRGEGDASVLMTVVRLASTPGSTPASSASR
jgi:quercetin dioxygenase-like cupin family protein